jgi:hypothetical protein
LIQQMKVAAMKAPLRKFLPSLSFLVAMRRQSLTLYQRRSMRFWPCRPAGRR